MAENEGEKDIRVHRTQCHTIAGEKAGGGSSAGFLKLNVEWKEGGKNCRSGAHPRARLPLQWNAPAIQHVRSKFAPDSFQIRSRFPLNSFSIPAPFTLRFFSLKFKELDSTCACDSSLCPLDNLVACIAAWRNSAR